MNGSTPCYETVLVTCGGVLVCTVTTADPKINQAKSASSISTGLIASIIVLGVSAKKPNRLSSICFYDLCCSITGGWAGIMGSRALLNASAKNSKKTGLRMAKINHSGDNRTIISQLKAGTSLVYP